MKQFLFVFIVVLFTALKIKAYPYGSHNPFNDLERRQHCDHCPPPYVGTWGDRSIYPIRKNAKHNDNNYPLIEDSSTLQPNQNTKTGKKNENREKRSLHFENAPTWNGKRWGNGKK
uniref:Uncharacterized protein n=1 Tax=Panagrolaimus sp. ES5 TaxID=591445 RepID=A0AC34G4Z9_9BILA